MKSIILFMSFSELEFKWSVHVIDSLNQLHPIHIFFLIVSNDLFISWLREVQKTTTNMAI